MNSNNLNTSDSTWSVDLRSANFHTEQGGEEKHVNKVKVFRTGDSLLDRIHEKEL